MSTSIRILDEKELLKACKAERLPVRYLFVSNDSSRGVGRMTVVSYGPDRVRLKYLIIYWSVEPCGTQLQKVLDLVRQRLNCPELHLEVTEQEGTIHVDPPIEPAPCCRSLRKEFCHEAISSVLSAEVPADALIPHFTECTDSRLQAVIGKLRSVLAKQPAIRDLDNRCVTCNCISAPPLSVSIIANWLLRTRQQSGVETAMTYLSELVLSEEVVSTEVLFLTGFHVEDEIELFDNVTLCPIEPPGEQERNQRLWEHDTNQPYIEVSAALMKDVKLPKMMSPTHPKQPREVIQTHELLLEVASVLVLANAGPAVPYNMRTCGPEWHPFPGNGSVDLEIDPLSSRWHEDFFPARPHAVQDIVQRYLGCSKELRQKLSVPLHRLNRAFRRRTAVETALDLGTALESILAPGLDSQQSISHAVRTRGALLLASTLAERKRIKTLLSKIYDLRSKATHTGKVKDETVLEGVRTSTGYVLQDGLHICRSLIFRLIELGYIPVWEELELGSAPAG